MVRKVKQVDSVNSLLHGDNKVDHAEVVLEAVADEDTPAVHQEPGCRQESPQESSLKLQQGEARTDLSFW